MDLEKIDPALTDDETKFTSLLEEKKLNSSNLSIRSRDLLLVPYDSEMIPKYCSWFLDDLCKMTSTEGLTEAEARDAHRIWTTENDKVVFVVLDRKCHEKSHDSISSMIGDVNLVIRRDVGQSDTTAEVMLMIGEIQFRGKGFGRQMLKLIMRFACEEYSVTTFEARINIENTASLALFHSCRFQTVSSNEVFGEHLLKLEVEDSRRKEIIDDAGSLEYTVEFR